MERSPIQLGGLARRYNFVQSLVKDRGWNVVLAGRRTTMLEETASLADMPPPRTLVEQEKPFLRLLVHE